jgi:hypothetical protein
MMLCDEGDLLNRQKWRLCGRIWTLCHDGSKNSVTIVSVWLRRPCQFSEQKSLTSDFCLWSRRKRSDECVSLELTMLCSCQRENHVTVWQKCHSFFHQIFKKCCLWNISPLGRGGSGLLGAETWFSFLIKLNCALVTLVNKLKLTSETVALRNYSNVRIWETIQIERNGTNFFAKVDFEFVKLRRLLGLAR